MMELADGEQPQHEVSTSAASASPGGAGGGSLGDVSVEHRCAPWRRRGADRNIEWTSDEW